MEVQRFWFRGGPCGLEKESSFPGVTQQVSGKAGIRTQAFQFPAQHLFPAPPCLCCTLHLVTYGCRITAVAG